MTFEELFDLAGRILGIPSTDVTLETSPATVASWDSYNALMLIAEIEERAGVSFSLDEAVSIKSIGDIVQVLHKHGVATD